MGSTLGSSETPPHRRLLNGVPNLIDPNSGGPNLGSTPAGFSRGALLPFQQAPIGNPEYHKPGSASIVTATMGVACTPEWGDRTLESRLDSRRLCPRGKAPEPSTKRTRTPAPPDDTLRVAKRPAPIKQLGRVQLVREATPSSIKPILHWLSPGEIQRGLH
ncbi:hypothetical protein JTB14_006015 [Gonioctena quinquepunctata]|nr:hypothetical protein JTB14_006015 [Gonioctena quinquepunctata]